MACAEHILVVPEGTENPHAHQCKECGKRFMVIVVKETASKEQLELIK